MESEKLISNYTPNPRSKENDLENDFNYGNNVISASAEVRKGFLRKVYGILTVQLLMTCGVSGTVFIMIENFDSKVEMVEKFRSMVIFSDLYFIGANKSVFAK